MCKSGNTKGRSPQLGGSASVTSMVQSVPHSRSSTSCQSVRRARLAGLFKRLRTCQVAEWSDVCSKPAGKGRSKSRDTRKEASFLQSCDMNLIQRTEEKPVRGPDRDKRQDHQPARILTDVPDFSLQAWERSKNSKPTRAENPPSPGSVCLNLAGFKSVKTC